MLRPGLDTCCGTQVAVEQVLLISFGSVLGLGGSIMGSIALERFRERRNTRMKLFLDQLPSIRISFMPNHMGTRISPKLEAARETVQDMNRRAVVLSSLERKHLSEMYYRLDARIWLWKATLDENGERVPLDPDAPKKDGQVCDLVAESWIALHDELKLRLGSPRSRISRRLRRPRSDIPAE